MSAKIVDLPTPPPKPTPQKKSLVKAIGVIVLSMFVIGIAMGSCSLGMKLPVALFELATGKPAT